MTVALGYDPNTNTINITGESSKDDLFEYLATLTGSEIKTHLALVLYTNSKGQCWPGQKTLERITGLTRKTIQTAIAGLTAKVGLLITQRKGQSNLYTLPVREKLPEVREKLPMKVVSSYISKRIYIYTTKYLVGKNYPPPKQLPLPEEWKPVKEKLEKLFSGQANRSTSILSDLLKSDLIPQEVRQWIALYEDKRDSRTVNGLGWLVNVLKRAIAGEADLPEDYQVSIYSLPMEQQLAALKKKYATPADYVGHLGITS